MKKQKKSYYIYLNSELFTDKPYEFHTGNFAYSDTGENLLADNRFKLFHDIFENFREHSFLILELTDQHIHEIFKFSIGITARNFWAFQYYLFLTDHDNDNFSTFPASLNNFPKSANISLIQEIIKTQFVSRFYLINLDEVKNKIDQLVVYFKTHPKNEDRFYNTHYFLTTSYLSLKNENNFPIATIALTSAYESLFHFNSGNFIFNNINERLKYLHLVKDDFEPFKELYKLRSRYIHGDIKSYIKLSQESPMYDYFKKMTEILINSMNIIIEKNISYKELERIKYTPPNLNS